MILALHTASQAQLPVTMLAAGLPQLLGSIGRAKSYAGRLFESVPIGRFDRRSAAEALHVPAGREGDALTNEAVQIVVDQSRGYPHFIQE